MAFVLLLKHDPIVLITLYFSVFLSTFFILTFLKNKKNLGNPKLKRYPKVSILIPVYNEAKTIESTVENALQIDWPKNKIEIMIIENGGSTDGTYDLIKKYRPRGIKIFSLKKGGKGNAMNFGISKASGEIIISMDADTYAEKDILKKIIPYFDDPKVMVSSPAILARNPKTFAQKVQSIEYLFGVFLRKVFYFLGAVYVTPGAFTAYRRTFFKKHGGYDTTNITEDFELCLRAQSLDYKVANSLGAIVTTKTPRTFRALHKQRLRWFVGFIDTALQHKSLFFNPKKGALGVIVLPAAIISIALTLIIFTKIVRNSIINTINWIQRYELSRSIDLVPYLYSFKFDLFYFKIDTILMGITFLIALGVYMFIIARKHSREDGTFILSYLFYFIIYIYLFSFWWMHSIFIKIFGSKHLRFGGQEWNRSLKAQLFAKIDKALKSYSGAKKNG